MRTTIDLNDAVFRAAKQRAARDGATLREIVEAALRQYLKPALPAGKFRLRLKPGSSGRLLPGVVIEDRNSLFDIMDGRS